MSSRKRRTVEKSDGVPPPHGPTVAVAVDELPQPQRGLKWWWIALAVAASLFIAFEVYGPSLNGAFLFDDDYLPFLVPDVQNAPLRAWLGVRPLLMVSYWLNYRYSGLEPYAYHAVGVFLHSLNAILAWLIIRKLLELANSGGKYREWIAGFCGGLFLLHPIQTESVAYVTSRSESMSVFFFLAAYAVFLYRPKPAISILRTLAILVLFAVAATSKEHTVVLPALLLLTDYFFTTPFRFDGIKQNLKLYAPIAVGGVIGLMGVWKVLSTAQTAGFKVQEFTWYQYLFTQFRVILSYLRLYVLPLGQNGDYEYPVSHTIVEHGAIGALFVLGVLVWLAWSYRRRFPLLSYGFLGFLLLLAPTSSVVPIRDVIVERRLYLPFICLLAITAGLLSRWRPQPGTLAAVLSAVLVVAGIASYNRNQVWAGPLPFWQDTVKKSPNNARAHFQLAYANWHAGNCSEAVKGYEQVARLQKPDDRLLVDWALALECANRIDEAVAKMRAAAAVAPTAHVYAQIGMICGKHGRIEEALAALDQAEKIDPRFEMTYVYRGNIAATRQDFAAAAGYYRHALAINPNNETAHQALALAERGLAAQPR